MLLPTRGPLSLTPTEVARRAGVSPGSFYQYFPSKQALLAELAEQWMQRHLEDLTTCLPLLTGSDGASSFVHALRERFAARPNMHHVLMTSVVSIEDNVGINAMRDRTTAVLAQAIGESGGSVAPLLMHQLDSTLTALCLGLIPPSAERAALSMLVRSVGEAVASH